MLPFILLPSILLPFSAPPSAAAAAAASPHGAVARPAAASVFVSAAGGPAPPALARIWSQAATMSHPFSRGTALMAGRSACSMKAFALAGVPPMASSTLRRV